MAGRIWALFSNWGFTKRSAAKRGAKLAKRDEQGYPPAM